MNYKNYWLAFIFLLLTGCEAPSTITIESTPTIFETQMSLQSAYQAEYEQSSYSIASPYIVHNPYQNSPLSYLIMFETTEPLKIRYSVVGHRQETTLSFETSDYKTSHQITLIGLYPDEENTIYLTGINENNEEFTYPLTIQTSPLPQDVLDIWVTQPTTQIIPNRLFLMTDDHYKYLIDYEGEIRWLQTSSSGSITPLKNGNLLTYNGPYYYYYQQRLEEIDYLGQVHQQLYIPGSGHHSLSETQSGEYVINSSDKTDERYAEDVIYIINPQSGDVTSTINMRDYLDINRFSETLPEAVKGDFNDWFHLNYAMLDEQDQTIIASGRSQSMVVKLDPKTSEIKWILGAHDEVDDTLKPYLLTPISENFSWPFAQHSAKVIDDLDQDPETIDLILFDNHVDIGVFDKQSYPDLNQFSRAVHYRINECDMTIEQIWSFGEQLSPRLVSTIISEIDYLPSNETMLVLYGFLSQNQRTGGKLFEVDAHDSNTIHFEMELFQTGLNHLYTIEIVDFSSLNLDTPLMSSLKTPVGAQELNRFKDTVLSLSPTSTKTYDAKNVNTIELSDRVLLIDGYIKKTSITDPLALVLTHESGSTYSFTISPADTYAVKSTEDLPRSLQKRYDQSVKNQTLYQYIDRTDLSELPAGTYQVTLYLEDSTQSLLYETPYQFKLEP